MGCLWIKEFMVSIDSYTKSSAYTLFRFSAQITLLRLVRKKRDEHKKEFTYPASPVFSLCSKSKSLRLNGNVVWQGEIHNCDSVNVIYFFLVAFVTDKADWLEIVCQIYTACYNIYGCGMIKWEPRMQMGMCNKSEQMSQYFFI